MTERGEAGGRMEERTGTLLDDLLTGLDARVDAFALCRVARGRALALPATPFPLIHYVLRGPGILRFEGGAPVPFAQHDFVLLPPGRAHRIEAPDGCADSVVEVRALDRLPVLAGGMLEMATSETAAGAVTTCGSITAALGVGLGLFDTLREPIAHRLTAGDPLRGAFEAMLSELASPRFGTRAMTGALLKQCLVWLLRRRLEDEADGCEIWPFGAADPRLARAVRAILDRPADPFTVEGLARTAGMSRSGFADRFTWVFGLPPIEFVKRVRLRHAAELLRATDLPVVAVAAAVGYGSRSYLARAFHAAYGLDPKAYRAAQRRPG